MKKSLYIAANFGFALMIFSGCSGKTITVEKPISDLTSDKTKAYIAFSYKPPNIMGPAPEALLYEFNLKTNYQKELVDFDTHGTYLQSVTPGEHYYIIRRVMPTLALAEDIKYQFTVDAIQGKITYVDLQMLKVITEQRERLETKLKEMPCNSANISQYGFEEVKEKSNSSSVAGIKMASNTDEIAIRKYTSDLFGGMQLNCKNNKVIELTPVNSFFAMATLDSLKALPLIEPSKSNDDSKLLEMDDIKVKYNIFHEMHKDAMQKYPFEIYQYADVASQHQYTGIELEINFLSKVEKDDKDNIQAIIKDAFSSFSSPEDTKQLKLIVTVDNYVVGSRGGRYFALSSDNAIESMASIQISVDFIDSDTGKLIGKVKDTKVLGIGIFGGSSSGIVEDAVDEILKYTKSVYLKV